MNPPNSITMNNPEKKVSLKKVLAYCYLISAFILIGLCYQVFFLVYFFFRSLSPLELFLLPLLPWLLYVVINHTLLKRIIDRKQLLACEAISFLAELFLVYIYCMTVL